MANQTKYLKLNKPQIGTTGWGNAINNNFETLDTSYGTLRANMSSIENRLVENSVYKFWYKGITIDGVEAKDYDYIYILLDGKENMEDGETCYTSFHVCYATGQSTDKKYPLFSIPSFADNDTGVNNTFHYSFETDTTEQLQGLNQLDNFTSFYVIGTIDEVKKDGDQSGNSDVLELNFYITPNFDNPSVYNIKCDDNNLIKVSVGDILVMQRVVENNQTKMRPTKLSQALGYVYGWKQGNMNTNEITAYKVPVPVAQNEVSLYVPTVINKSVQVNTGWFNAGNGSDYTITTKVTTIGKYHEFTVDESGEAGIREVKYSQLLANVEFFYLDTKPADGDPLVGGQRSILDYSIDNSGESFKIQLTNPSGFQGYCTYTILHSELVTETDNNTNGE